MEAAVEQCSVDRKCCEIQQKQFLIENDRLLDQIISQDIMNIVVNSSIVMCDFVKKNDDAIDICNKCLELEAEFVKKNDVYIELSNVSKPNATTIAPRMFKLDLETLALKVLKNKDAHLDYIKAPLGELGAVLSEPMVCPLNVNEVDFRISLDESDDEDYTVIFDENSTLCKLLERIDDFNLIDEALFSEYDEEIVSRFNDLFNIIHLDDSKLKKDNDDNDIDIIQSSEGNEITHGKMGF
ncbi:hypothetical protein Tco_0126533 [Tanacetum coccineum]